MAWVEAPVPLQVLPLVPVRPELCRLGEGKLAQSEGSGQ